MLRKGQKDTQSWSQNTMLKTKALGIRSDLNIGVNSGDTEG